ncbi:hypothetical protein O6H91_14G001000 [Diphasiastrum complanatum]|uniref:Uncharacterized protein n=3 Tax=Diphasiastrum complanatum TaxID=34168 RepID=A0ACC2BKZ5_DIPCM|nr:hypothetical protein O6H91_14G001000 [Diphasiastrum complanatum]KAJ7530363.1 hypothetical protein O6H91_14G001000 [Diphasiastrum complanatum]KAJ7530364.1 hypothetical protein O6H91_14G001000 [Diphasiastrum complanatum]
MSSSSSTTRRQKDAYIPLVTDATPLLASKRGGSGFKGASTCSAIFNLSTTIVGAGIMALPATQKQLGLPLGLASIIVIGILTDSSLELLIRFSKSCKALSYGAVMEDAFGAPGRALLQICIIINNLGLLIVYMIIIGDVLSGTGTGESHHRGLLEVWAGGATWWNGRVVVLFLTTIFILVPLVSFKRVDSLKFSSALSVALAVVFVVITAGIAIRKLVAGKIPMPRMVPDVHDQYSFWKLFTAVPVMVTAYICHHNVHPISNELEDTSIMKRVCRSSVALCTLIYIATALFGYLLFGENTMDDILANFDADLGIPYGRILSAIVQIGYAVHLMLVFPLLHFSLRLNLDALVFPTAPSLANDTRRFILVTTLLMGIIFFGSTLVPSIWSAFQFTGATAAVCLGFIFPGAIAIRDQTGISTSYDKGLAWSMVILASVSSLTAITTNIMDIFNVNHHQNQGSPGPAGISPLMRLY